MEPLAERLRPRQLNEFVGQEHLVGPEGPIRRALEAKQIPSMLLWGPPGSGKTTLATLLGRIAQAEFHHLSAVLSGVDDLRKLLHRIEAERGGLFPRRHILFIDEIHRWNKAQQDALLPYVERGTVTLVGATTENPSFEVISPLLSRCTVYCLYPLRTEDLRAIGERTLTTLKRTAEADAITLAIAAADGDARRLINLLELSATLHGSGAEAEATSLTPETLLRAAQQQPLRYDKSGEEHYNLISAFIKSMRGSDPHAAVYYLARMYEAGEDPRFLARRMVIFASEDVGAADAHALPMAVAAFQAYEIVGQAEGWIPLAHVAIYLANAPKSNATYMAYKAAKADVTAHGALAVPLHLRNAPTKLMKELGYGRDYKYPHSEGSAGQTYLPEALRQQRYYRTGK